MDAISYRYGTHTELRPEIQSIFDRIPTVRVFAKNESIYNQGDEAICFYYIKGGQVKVYMNSAHGMEATLNVTGKGNVIGEAAFFDKMPRVSSAKALTKVDAVPVNSKMLLKLFSTYPQLAMEMLNLQARSIRMLSTQIDNMIFMQADSRIAQLLLQSYNEIDGEKTVKFTHEEIGNIVGVSRVTVSKTLNEFCRNNLIKTRYRAIIITNENGLRSIAQI